METIGRHAMLIGGDWLETDDRFEIRSPGTEGEILANKGGRYLGDGHGI
jgi:hypothetical protein